MFIILILILILLALNTFVNIKWYMGYSEDRKRRIRWYLDWLKDKADWKKRWYFVINWKIINYCLNHRNLFIWDDIKKKILQDYYEWKKFWKMNDNNWNEIWNWNIS